MTVGSSALSGQTSQSDDVYEFRSSPESDVDANVSFFHFDCLSSFISVYLI